MKNKLIFILWLLMFSFFSCDFGIKENEETNSKEYFTVKGSCSIQGAIPSDLLPKKSINQNAQRTVVPNEIAPEVITVIFESETGETKSAEVVKNDGVLNFEIELPAGKWTVKAQGKKSNVVIIESKSYQIELSAEKTNANVAVILKPIQSENGQGSFTFSFGDTHDYTSISGLKYTYKKIGASVETSETIDEFNNTITITLSPGVYTFRFDFYSDMECKDQLLYSFTEVVNIFDGLTTDTWIGAGEYINDEGEICITDTMISQFVSTTVYVSEFGKDSNLGTFFEPVKTIQKAVDKVIAMNVDTASNEEKPYKIFLLSDIISDDPFENNNNALVNIDPSSTLYLEISKYGDENATINAKNTGRVMYIGENANVTLQNLILTGGYLADNNEPCDGAGLYIKNNATVKIKNCEISGNHAKNGGGLYLCPNANDDGGNFLELSNCTISGNTATSSGGGILFCPTHGSSDDKITTLNLTNCTISSNTATQKGGGIYSYGKNPKVILDACNITNNSLGSESSVPNAYGGGIYGENGTKIDMNDTTIFGNKVASVNDVEGAGVCLHGANLTMNGGLISENECYSNYSSSGGGVYIYNSSKFTMTSGVISENSAKYGGGVSVSGGTFIMEGGSISNNTVTENGKGVYVVKNNNIDSLFEISGDASITENDVYLTKDQKITITEDLTSYPVATITPQNYAENSAEDPAKKVQVLDAVGGITLSEQVVKFHVTKYSDDVVTTITNDGYLENTIEATKLDINLYDICTTINVSSAKGMNKLSQLAGKDFAGKTINLKAHVKLDTEYEPIHTFSGVFDGGRCSIEIEAPETYAWDSPKGKALFYFVEGENAEIKDLTVKGTAEGAGIAYTLTNKAKISNCKSYVNITTQKQSYPTPGGIVSHLNNGSRIENCENRGTIICDGENTGGGIVGSMASSDENDCREYPVIANCTNYGNVTINDATINDAPVVVKMGGICGWIYFGTIFNCANKGKVSVTDNKDGRTEILGGIVGHCYGTKIEGIINCYNSGEIYGSSNCADQNIGGIVGMYSYNSAVVQVPKFVNTVNNYDQILSFGTLGQIDTTNTKDNYYKKNERSTNYHPYEKTFANNIDSVINTLNAYSNTNGYLQWDKDKDGNIIFSKDISDNQGNTP